MDNVFPILEQYCNYMLAVLARSELTVKEYEYDLICFFRFYKRDHGLVDKGMPLEQISIDDVDSKLLSKKTTDDLLVFLIWLTRERKLSPASRARRIATLKSFFKYCHSKKHILESNPAYDLETPRIGKRVPKYLTLEESTKLLSTAYESPSATNVRDYCILTLFLNCGMRLSELRGINTDDIHGTTLTVIGKGDKERTVYLNKACLEALNDYYPYREQIKVKPSHKKALFLSSRGQRISDDMIQIIIKRLMLQAGIDTKVFSVHKLRHTCATLMYKYGHVDIRSLQVILGHKSVSTTQIYTHVDEEQLQDAVESNPLASFNPEK